jgi:hypothetical protein
MKRLVYVSTLLGFIALMILLVVGSAGAVPLAQFGPGEIEPEPEPGGGLPGGEGEPEPGGSDRGGAGPALQEDGADPDDPMGTAARINFEVSGHKARRGLYLLQEPDGNVLASWYALDGWTDSGWFHNLHICYESAHVQVLYYPGPNTNPTVMRILNHAPGSAYGWVSRGMGHAIEVAWPDQPLMNEEAPDFSDRGL